MLITLIHQYYNILLLFVMQVCTDAVQLQSKRSNEAKSISDTTQRLFTQKYELTCAFSKNPKTVFGREWERYRISKYIKLCKNDIVTLHKVINYYDTIQEPDENIMLPKFTHLISIYLVKYKKNVWYDNHYQYFF